MSQEETGQVRRTVWAGQVGAEWNRKTVSTGQENSQDGLGGKLNGTGGGRTGQEDDGTDYEGGHQVRR